MILAWIAAAALSQLTPLSEPSGFGTSGGVRAKMSYKMCQVVNGAIFSCPGGWYQGKAVVLHGGVYIECSITNGEIFSCGGWYQGKAVVLHKGAYQECSITNGAIFSCGGWFQGNAVAYTDK